MNISHITEKTVVIETANGTKVKVSSLPENIRFEVDTLDRYNQQRMDILCQLEIMELAIHSQKMKIGELVKNALPQAPSLEGLPESNHE